MLRLVLTTAIAILIAAIVGTTANARRYPEVRSWLLKTHHWCLVQIIDHEDGTYEPQRSGIEGYGLPQAWPGSKMESAGRDWATNPYTQIKWMIGYVNTRYGGECQAWSYWQAHRRY